MRAFSGNHVAWNFQQGIRYSCHAFRRALGLLLQGEAQVYRPGEDGRRVVMNRLTTGEVFGAAALFKRSVALDLAPRILTGTIPTWTAAI